MPEKRLISFRKIQKGCRDKMIGDSDYGERSNVNYCYKICFDRKDKPEIDRRCNASNCPVWRRAVLPNLYRDHYEKV